MFCKQCTAGHHESSWINIVCSRVAHWKCMIYVMFLVLINFKPNSSTKMTNVSTRLSCRKLQGGPCCRVGFMVAPFWLMVGGLRLCWFCSDHAQTSQSYSKPHWCSLVWKFRFWDGQSLPEFGSGLERCLGLWLLPWSLMTSYLIQP